MVHDHASTSTVRNDLEKFCVKLHSELAAVRADESLTSLSISAEKYAKRGAAIASLQHYRHSLTDLLKHLGVAALDSFRSGSEDTFSVPSLIADIDALLPKIAFRTTNSAAVSATKKAVVLGHDVQASVLNNQPLRSSSAEVAKVGGKRARDAAEESGEGAKHKKQIAEAVKVEAPSEDALPPLVRKATSFLSVTEESAAAPTSLNFCSYEGLLKDYSLPTNAFAADNNTNLRRQDIVTTTIDVVMRAIVGSSSNLVTSSNCNSTTGTAPATPNTTPAAASTTLFVPPFNLKGAPFRYMQVTGQGGGNIVTTFAPFRFM